MMDHSETTATTLNEFRNVTTRAICTNRQPPCFLPKMFALLTSECGRASERDTEEKDSLGRNEKQIMRLQCKL